MMKGRKMKTTIERQPSPEFINEPNETKHEKTPRTSLTDFFRNSPLYGVDLDLERRTER
ncbi:hypothetical protein QUF80_04065 [Desulfococcaceae bacterium HSG8]|nr:hypothetical protein [Desulfococcaceae bacterium HSG8]